MKKELPYFSINGGFGGNQSWFLDPWMHIGGCGALTMCDFLIYMAKNRNRTECYPYDINALSKKDYRRFGMSMKPYLRPRESGIKDLETFIDGAGIYLEDSEIEGITVEPFDGHRPYEEAEAVVRDRIDSGLPLAMLMLRHQNKRFNFFEWHWFLIVGFDEKATDDGEKNAGDNSFMIKVATYGKEHWLPFEEFWDTGDDERGGLVVFDLRDEIHK